MGVDSVLISSLIKEVLMHATMRSTSREDQNLVGSGFQRVESGSSLGKWEGTPLERGAHLYFYNCLCDEASRGRAISVCILVANLRPGL